MAISFNSIAASVRTPGAFIEFDNTRAVQGLSNIPKKALIIGQITAGATILEDVPTLVASSSKGETFFGHGSLLAGMIEAYKEVDPHTELWAIGIDDAGAGVVATGTYTWAGTSTEAASIFVYIGGERIEVAIPDATAAAAVGPLVVTAVTNHVLTSNLPVSAAGGVAVTTITCLHKGTAGNSIDLAVNLQEGEALPAGITVSIVQMASGATDDPISGPIAVFADSWYSTIVSQYSDDTNVTLLETQATTQWGPMIMKDTHIFIAGEGNQGALTSLGNARNSQFTTLVGAGLSPTPPWIWAAKVAALDTKEPDPARPRQTLKITGVRAPLPASRFTQAERAILLTDGVATYTVGQDGSCFVERLITTYQTNALSALDVSYLDITTMRTLALIRYQLRTRIALRFPRHKLANDGTNFAPGQAVATPATIRSEVLALFVLWEAEGLVEGWEQFKTDIIVERNSSDVNRVDVQLSPDLMNQFRTMAGQIQFLL